VCVCVSVDVALLFCYVREVAGLPANPLMMLLQRDGGVGVGVGVEGLETQKVRASWATLIQTPTAPVDRSDDSATIWRGGRHTPGGSLVGGISGFLKSRSASAVCRRTARRTQVMDGDVQQAAKFGVSFNES